MQINVILISLEFAKDSSKVLEPNSWGCEWTKISQKCTHWRLLLYGVS